LLLGFFALISADSDVVVLTDADFDRTLEENEFVFVEFYAPWCGHCKNLAPDYEKLATKFKDAESKVVIAKVDATVETECAQKHEVRGYPTLKFFRSGKPVAYEGERKVGSMFNWIEKKSGPPSKHLTSKDDVEKFLKGDGTRIIAYVSDDSEWVELCKSGDIDDFALGHVTDAEVRGDAKENSVHIHKEGDEPAVFEDDFSVAAVGKFIKAEGFPLVEELAQGSWMRAQGSKTPLLAVFFKAITDETESELRAVAKEFKGEVVFTSSNQ
jgi:protein disulfide-isomerase A1